MLWKSREDHLIDEALAVADLDAEALKLKLQWGVARKRKSVVAITVLCATVLAGVVAWATRWQAVVPPGSSGYPGAFLVNRWTGEIRYLQGVNWIAVDELKK